MIIYFIRKYKIWIQKYVLLITLLLQIEFINNENFIVLFKKVTQLVCLL